MGKGDGVEKIGGDPLAESHGRGFEFRRHGGEMHEKLAGTRANIPGAAEIIQQNEEILRAARCRAALISGNTGGEIRNIVVQNFLARREVLSKAGKKKMAIASELISSALLHQLSAAKTDDQRRIAVEQYDAFLRDSRQEGQAELLAVLKISVPMADKKFEEKVNEAEEQLPENFETLKAEQQIEIARALAQKYSLSENPEQIRDYLLMYEKKKADVELLSGAISDEKFVNVLADRARTAKDKDASGIFDATLRQTRGQEYRRYREMWTSRNVAPLRQTASLPGSPANLSSPSAKEAIRTVRSEGIAFKRSETDTSSGIVQVGTFSRPAFLRQMGNGAVGIFIVDSNADKGVRGPINPADMRREIKEIQVDASFRRNFNKFSTLHPADASQSSPSSIADADLAQIAAAVIPKTDLLREKLEAGEERIVANIAYLFAAPDGENVSMHDKVALMKRIASDPQRLAAMRRQLQSKDFSKTKVRLGSFKSAVDAGSNIVRD